VEDRDHQKYQRARDLLATRRNTEEDQAETYHQQPQRREVDRKRRETGEEFPHQQRVAVDRLRQDAGQRAPVVLAVDGIETQSDRHQRDQKAENGDKGRQRIVRKREQPQQQERILRRG